MNTDDIQQKLALLPEGIAENNLDSWKKIVRFYKEFIDYSEDYFLLEYPMYKFLFPIYNLVKEISMTQQAKLFRAGQSMYDLVISTAEKHGLKLGDHSIRVFIDAKLITIQYDVGSPLFDGDNPNIYESHSCNPNDNLMVVLQPLLNRLWEETRGKKNV